MKKTKKAIASLAIAGMALTMIPFNVLATGTVPNRLSGVTAEQTAVQIADQTGWTGKAILASSASYGMVDALTAGPLASYLHAPILLTGAGNVLDASTKAELTKLAVTTVYVTSGTAVISQGVLDELAAMNITVVKLGGVDRAATSVNIAKQMVGVTKVAIANSVQDALSIAAIASAANQPILLTDKDVLPASVAAYLAANPGITSSDVIGGTGIISDAVKTAAPNSTRHAGNSAYDTNNQVIQDLASSLLFDQVYLANGATGIDALAGAPLAAKTKSAIVLTDGVNTPAAATFVSGKMTSTSQVTALGGAAVVPETQRNLGYVVPAALAVSSVSAINATQVNVVFTQAVDTAAAQTLTNYTLGGANPSAAALQADGVTVLLTFTSAQVKVTNAAFVVEPVTSKSDSGVLSVRYAGLFTANDTLAPAIKSVVSNTILNTASTVTVNFTEPVQSLGTVKIDGVVVTATNFVAGDVKAVFNNLSLDATTTHTLQIIGLSDRAVTANVAGVLSTSFSINKDTVAPIATLSAKGDHTILVTFDKEMNPDTVKAAFATGTTVVKDEVLNSLNSSVATVVPNTFNKQFTIEVTTGLYTDTKTSRTLTVVVPATITDVLGNAIAATTKQVTLTKDTVAPVITKASFVKAGDNTITQIRATVSEGLAGGAVTPTNANLTIVDEQGVLVQTTAFLAGLKPDLVVTAGSTELQFDATTAAKLSGKYTFTFAAGFVSDMAQTANTSPSASFELDFGTASAGTFTLVDGNANIAGNVITVNYTDAVHGGAVANAANNLANYTINGSALPVGTTITLNAAKTIATITLAAGSIATTDTGAIFTINNVQKTTGEVIAAFTKVITITDNVKPVLNSAVITSDEKLVLGFSEVLNAAPVAGDIELKINGIAFDLTGGTFVAGTGSDAGKYILDLTTTTSKVISDATDVIISFDGDNVNDAGDIVVKAGTTLLTSANLMTAANVTSITVKTAPTASIAATTVDKSTLANKLTGATAITVK